LRLWDANDLGKNAPEDVLKKALKKMNIDEPPCNVLVCAYRDKGWFQGRVVLTHDTLYFTAIKAATGGVIGKDYYWGTPVVHGRYCDISIGGKMSMLHPKDSRVVGNLYDPKGARSKEEAMSCTFGDEFIEKLKATIARAKELSGKK